MKTNQFIIEKPSRFGMDQTVDILVNTAIQKGWSHLATHDLQHSLEKSGKKVRHVKVIEICKPDYSGNMLEKNDERIMSVLMPCRVSVYMKDDGKVYVTLLNTSMLAAYMPVAIAKAMTGAADESFEIAQKVLA